MSCATFHLGQLPSRIEKLGELTVINGLSKKVRGRRKIT